MSIQTSNANDSQEIKYFRAGSRHKRYSVWQERYQSQR